MRCGQGLTGVKGRYSVALMDDLAPVEPILPRPAAPAGEPGPISPVMAQFFDAKARQPDALIFFRMGDFYELFFEDAAKAAAAIGIALTHRGTHAGAPIPMAGVPVHAAEAYLAKLIRAGFKVAVCEQMEDPAEARKRGGKSVVRREIVRVVTPGTLTEDGLLEARGANRLAAVAVRAGQAAVASVELSTGEVECFALGTDALAAALAALAPSEILVPDRLFAEPAISAALKAAGGAGAADGAGAGRAGRLRGAAEAALRRRDPRRLRRPDRRGGRRARPDRRPSGDHPGRPRAGAVGRRAAPARPTSWRSIRPPAPAWRSSGSQSGGARRLAAGGHRPHGDRARRAAAGRPAGPAADVARGHRRAAGRGRLAARPPRRCARSCARR